MSKKRLHFAGILFFLTFSSVSFAADLSCSIKAVARCICPASMVMDCGSGFSGYIANDEKPKSITISVFDKTTGKKQDVVLDNPPQGVRSYYAGIDGDPWVIRQLGDKGIAINSKTQLDMSSARFPDTVNLYSDENKNGPKSKNSAAAEAQFKYSCYYLHPPTVVSTPGCSQPACASRAKCWKDGRYLGETGIACKYKDSTCPSASACAADEDVLSDVPKEVGKESFEDGLRERTTK